MALLSCSALVYSETALGYSNCNSRLQSQPDRQPPCLHLASEGQDTQFHAEGLMIYWALVFLLVAVIAALFGFTGIALAAAGIAKLLFFIFLVLFVITFATHLTGRGGTRI